MKNVCIVSPVHIQPSDAWIKALEEAKADIIIVDDSDGKVKLPDSFDVYGYDRQKEELGEDLYKLFEQFHKSAACKNFGTWLAYKKGYEYIIVIDSDCIIPDGFVKNHLDNLQKQTPGWDNPLKNIGWFSRGYPYHEREHETWCHMGLWEHELDLYGNDRLDKERIPRHPKAQEYEVCTSFIPLSGMNLSFKREAIPYMLFLPNYKYSDVQFSRHDDIWGGYIFQKLLHTKKRGLSYGDPIVYHDTEVDAKADAKIENDMIKYEERFFTEIDQMFALYNLTLRRSGIEGVFGFITMYAKDKPFLSPLASAFEFWDKAFKT